MYEQYLYSLVPDLAYLVERQPHRQNDRYPAPSDTTETSKRLAAYHQSHDPLTAPEKKTISPEEEYRITTAYNRIPDDKNNHQQQQ